jgi:hypothetical protein
MRLCIWQMSGTHYVLEGVGGGFMKPVSECGKNPRSRRLTYSPTQAKEGSGENGR